MEILDKDLAFLAKCRNEELRVLCDILTYDRNGMLRYAEQLTGSDAYLLHYPMEMSQMAGEIADELCKFGSNTVVTYFRKGVPDCYETVVQRVCRQMKVQTESGEDVASMERKLLQKVCEDAVEQMSEEQIRELADEMGIKEKDLMPQFVITVLMRLMSRNPKLWARVIRGVIRVVLLDFGGRRVAMKGLERVLGVAAGPLGTLVMTLWTIWDIASPAYRVCIPAVLQVGLMRMDKTPRLWGRRAA